MPAVVHFVDVALAVMAFEAAWLAASAGARRRMAPLGDWALNLVAGACLLLALRFALAGSSWVAWCTALGAGGACHAIQLARRWGSVSRA